MPKQYEANTLEEAYEKASKSLSCSITDLHIEVIQSPSKGFLGLFAKKAIIQAKPKQTNRSQAKKPAKVSEIQIETLQMHLEKKDQTTLKTQKTQTPPKEQSNRSKQLKKEKIFEDFYDAKEDENLNNSEVVIKKQNDQILEEIHHKINDLFSKLCYEIDEVKVSMYDQKTVYIEFTGEDSALLIGKEGYRYKALSYILFNWINEKYDLMLRLEVAQFLQNQEDAIHNYLIPVIETIKQDGFYKTKPLDGILVHIALTKLRVAFPDKYVAVKTNVHNEKYILVNEYKS